MGLTDTPSANRLQIGLYGRRNSGKSSLLNALTGQEVSLVSEVAGTTTDPGGQGHGMASRWGRYSSTIPLASTTKGNWVLSGWSGRKKRWKRWMWPCWYLQGRI